ncbi:DUF5682 family protein [Microbacterium sp. P06]|uniref:DUF5682 family protein n=1 Tax=Microbacterium sp. P06 TaxID=3366949 RepID=UPI0037454CEF
MTRGGHLRERGERAAWGKAPERLQRAAAARGALAADGVHLAGIRHHSPACALAVRALIAEVRPSVVLIEGPAEFDRRLGELQDPATRPPIAVLSLAGEGAAFYPLAASSPEWVAVRAAADAGIPVAFIDSPVRGAGTDDRASDDALARTLQGEGQLARSRSIAALAQRLHCRDHDELWDQLFECRTPQALADAPTLLDDVFAWAALARLDYTDDELAHDDSFDREAHMLAHIRRHRAGGPVVVVTGAFHTLALVEALGDIAEGEPVRARAGAVDLEVSSSESWLIRYDNERLDALRGYGAGLPAPGFYERLWQELERGGDPGDLAIILLHEIAVAARGHGSPISAAQLIAAAEAARRLAELRERPWPCRTDLLDAVASCFADGEGVPPAVRRGVGEVFGGATLGEVAPSVDAPPLVREARARAVQLGLGVDTSTTRVSRLDRRATGARAERHRARGRYFALMALVDSGFSRRLTGPDFAAGTGLGRAQEEWEYAWTPAVEAALIARSLAHPTLEAAALSRIAHRADAAGDGAGASARVSAALVDAVTVGLHAIIPDLGVVLTRALHDDGDIGSVAAALHRLAALWEARTELDLERHEALVVSLFSTGAAALAYRIPGLAAVGEDEEGAAIEALVSTRALGDRLGRTGLPVDIGATTRAAAVVGADAEAAPGVRAAILGLAAAHEEMSIEEFARSVASYLSPGAEASAAARFVGGLMRAASDLVVHTPEVIDTVGASLAAMSEESFLSRLPDLRRAFSTLRPTETHEVATRVAQSTGVGAESIDVVSAFTEDDVRTALAVEQQLARSLGRDGLADWVPTGGRR